MRKVKIISSNSCKELENEINEELQKLDDLGIYIIDIKYTCVDFNNSAMIFYEDNLN